MGNVTAKAGVKAFEKVGKGGIFKNDASNFVGGLVVPTVGKEAVVGAAKYEIDVVKVERVKGAGKCRFEMGFNGFFKIVVEKKSFESLKLIGEKGREGMSLAFPREDEEVFKVAVFVFGLFEVFHVNHVIGSKDEAPYET